MIRVTSDIAIPAAEVRLSFVRSSGPGGQHVNKVATAVHLRFDVRNSRSLSDEVRQRLLRQAGGRINADGVLLIDARAARTQEANRRQALAKLVQLVSAAAVRPKVRRATAVPRAAKERRMDGKKHRGKIKLLRRNIGWD